MRDVLDAPLYQWGNLCQKWLQDFAVFSFVKFAIPMLNFHLRRAKYARTVKLGEGDGKEDRRRGRGEESTLIKFVKQPSSGRWGTKFSPVERQQALLFDFKS